MPYYKYRCIKCEELFEEKRSMDERNNIKCPKCGGHANIVPASLTFSFKEPLR